MQLYPLRLISDNTKFDFMKFSKFSYFFSILLVVSSLICLFTLKLNFGIDFSGGITIELRTEKALDLARIRTVLNDLEIGEISLYNIGSQKDIAIRVAGDLSEENLMKNIDLIKQTLANNFDDKISYRKTDFVGPQVGAQLINSGATAVFLSFLSIMLYIWFRFEWQFGVGILISLVHDVIISLGFMSVSDLDFNLSSVAAILTIIGYSVNDSVVIYDRIRENLRKYQKMPIEEIINLSTNETLSRTTLTILTTLIANLALIIWGGEAIKSFSILMFFGILIGTYSSIYVSAPLISVLNVKRAVIK